MADEYFAKLIERYADGRPICNCGEAYSSPCGKGSVFNEKLGQRENRDDLLACEWGCQTNQIIAKEYVAKCVLKELKKMEKLLEVTKE